MRLIIACFSHNSCPPAIKLLIMYTCVLCAVYALHQLWSVIMHCMLVGVACITGSWPHIIICVEKDHNRMVKLALKEFNKVKRLQTADPVEHENLYSHVLTIADL